MTQVLNEGVDNSSETGLASQKRPIKSSVHKQNICDSIVLQVSKNDHAIQKRPKNKRASNEPSPKNDFTHQMKCLKREIKVQKVLIEDLKEEVKRKSRSIEHPSRTTRKKTRALRDIKEKLRDANEH